MKVRELKGFKSYCAFQVFHALLIGLKMIPDYAAIDADSFFEYCSALTLGEQEKLIRTSVKLTPLNEDEVKKIICFVEDKNGVAYQEANLKNLTPFEIVDIVTIVCMEFCKMKVDLISSHEKKN